MANQAHDRLIRAYTKLHALRSHVPEGDVDARFGRKYNEAAETIASELAVDLSDYRLPADYFFRPVVSHSPSAGSKYGDEMVKGDPFLARFDALMGYLRAQMPEPAKRQIGF
jgi:hypothetical protein